MRSPTITFAWFVRARGCWTKSKSMCDRRILCLGRPMNKRVPSMLAGIVVLVGSAALFLREPLRAQTAAATSAKTVGQAFKNIQVLKNIPADELGVIRPE